MTAKGKIGVLIEDRFDRTEYVTSIFRPKVMRWNTSPICGGNPA